MGRQRRRSGAAPGGRTNDRPSACQRHRGAKCPRLGPHVARRRTELRAYTYPAAQPACEQPSACSALFESKPKRSWDAWLLWGLMRDFQVVWLAGARRPPAPPLHSAPPTGSLSRRRYMGPGVLYMYNASSAASCQGTARKTNAVSAAAVTEPLGPQKPNPKDRAISRSTTPATTCRLDCLLAGRPALVALTAAATWPVRLRARAGGETPCRRAGAAARGALQGGANGSSAAAAGRQQQAAAVAGTAQLPAGRRCQPGSAARRRSPRPRRWRLRVSSRGRTARRAAASPSRRRCRGREAGGWKEQAWGHLELGCQGVGAATAAGCQAADRHSQGQSAQPCHVPPPTHQ